MRNKISRRHFKKGCQVLTKQVKIIPLSSSVKRELNAKTNLFLFESIGIVDKLCKFFF